MHDPLPGGVLQFVHLHDGAARLADVAEIDHCAGLVFVFALGAHRDPGQKRQRSLGADQKMGDDVERIVETYQRQQVEPHDVLDRIFMQNALRQGLVAADPAAQRFDGAEESAVALRKGPAARSVARVEQRAVGQHQTRREQHPVAVGMGSAVHTRGVVHHDTAHHRAFDRSGVGRKAIPAGFEHLVDPCTHDAGLEPHGTAAVEDLATLPVFTRHNEHRIADGLPRKARSRGAERQRHARLTCRLHKADDLPLVGNAHDDLRDKTVKPGVGSPRQAAQVVRINPLTGYESAHGAQESAMFVGHMFLHSKTGEAWPLLTNIRNRSVRRKLYRSASSCASSP